MRDKEQIKHKKVSQYFDRRTKGSKNFERKKTKNQNF